MSNNIFGSSFTMNNEFNLSGTQITMKSKVGNSWPDISNEPVLEQVSVAPFLSTLLGSLPVLSDPGNTSLPPMQMASLAAVCTASKIVIGKADGLFKLNYQPSLRRVTNGSHGKNGILNKEELRKKILAVNMNMLADSDPARALYSQIMQEMLEEIYLSASLKGIQPNCAIGGDPVNLNTGNFFYENNDLSLKGGLPLEFIRFYNRIDSREGCMGRGWRHNYEIELIIDKLSFSVLWGDGREEVYLRDERDIPKPLFGNRCCLYREQDGFRYETREGMAYRFNGKGRLLGQYDRNGRGLSFCYDRHERLCKVSSQSAGSLFYKYQDNNGRLVEVSDQTGRKIILTYGLDQLVRVTNALGNTYSYLYNSDRALQKIRNPLGVVVLDNEYDHLERITKQTLADGSVMRYVYQDEANRTLFIQPNGNQAAYIHDKKYRNLKTTYHDGEETFVYNEQNQVVMHTDKHGNWKRFSYDDKGNKSQIIYSDGAKHSMIYDAGNRLLSLAVNGIIKLRNTYGPNGNFPKSEDVLGSYFQMKYDDSGKVLEIRRPDGKTVTFFYDETGHIIQVKNQAGNEIKYIYDGCGRIIRSADGNESGTGYIYDDCDQLISVVNDDGRKKTYEYNKNGKMTKITDFNGAITCMENNRMDQVKAMINPDGRKEILEYDHMQNVTKRLIPNGEELQEEANDKVIRECDTVDVNRIDSWDWNKWTEPLEASGLLSLTTLLEAVTSGDFMEILNY